MKYDKHRKLLLDDILASMARLPSSKQSLRSYRLSSQDHIQILTALVLQLIQCMVVLPKNASTKRSSVSITQLYGEESNEKFFNTLLFFIVGSGQRNIATIQSGVVDCVRLSYGVPQQVQ